jgi:hypothetical protein
MSIAVTADLVPCPNNVADHLRALLGHPTQDKEGCGDGVAIQKFQYAIDLRRYAGGESSPAVERGGTLNFSRMEVFLDIDCEGIDHPGRLYCLVLATKPQHEDHAVVQHREKI